MTDVLTYSAAEHDAAVQESALLSKLDAARQQLAAPFAPERVDLIASVAEALLGRRADASGPAAEYSRSMGVRAAAGSPVLVGGRLWGVMAVSSSRPLPADTEMRIAAFTELVATAIANTAARTELEQVAAEQAALGRVATLVAEAIPPGDVFTAVAAEVAGLFGVPHVGLFRYEREGVATVIAGAGEVSSYLGRR